MRVGLVLTAAAALAVAQSLGSSGRELLEASVVGYEVGIRVGEFLGRSHYRIFHTTGTAGTVAAAAATRMQSSGLGVPLPRRGRGLDRAVIKGQRRCPGVEVAPNPPASRPSCPWRPG